MSTNGTLTNGDGHGADAPVLRWTGRVLAAADLKRSLNGHREIVLPRRAVITPLAAEELRHGGIRVTRLDDDAVIAKVSENGNGTPAANGHPAGAVWGQAQERDYPLVQSAVKAAEHEGIALKELVAPGTGGGPAAWARAVAGCVAAGTCTGGVVFCADPGLVCCVANKFAGLRAVPVLTVAQAARATLSLAANLLAVEMPGRTFFEVRQILRLLCGGPGGCCPPDVLATLTELEHAHR